MRKLSRSTRPIDYPQPPERAEEPGAAKLAERAEAHRRWIGDADDDGEPVCRGID
jgi:hypothetical protein